MKFDSIKLYIVLLVACLAGYIWVYISVKSSIYVNNPIEVCLIKHTINIPCPSCGSTRSLISLIEGDFIGALKLNPLGYLIALIMILAPFWIIADTIMRKTTLFDFYRTMETYLKNPMYSIPLIILLVINWIWNITKGL